MITSRQKRRAARRVAVGVVVAGTLVGSGPVDAASTRTGAGHKPLSGDHPGIDSKRATHRAALQCPDPRYPNHKPLSGNYPGSYTSATTGAQQPSSGFDWLAAGAGAAAMLGLVLLVTAGRVGTRLARNRRYDVPLFLEVRDDTPPSAHRYNTPTS